MNSKWKKTIIFTTALLAATSFTACGFSRSQGTGSIPTLVAPAQEKKNTITVKRGDFELKSFLAGRIVPEVAKDMYFKGNGGYLSKINVKVGDEVKKGDIIAELDKDEINQQIKEQEIQLQLVKIDCEEAEKNNASDFDKERLKLRFSLEEMRLNQLNENLKNSTIISDMNGVVMGVQNFRAHQRVEAFQPLVVVAEKNKFLVQCDIRNAKLTLGTKVNIGIKIVLAQSSADGEVISNTILEQSPSKNNGNSNSSEPPEENSRIVIKFNSEPKNFKFGDDVTVHYIASKATNTLILPTNAIKFGAGNRPFVKLLKDGDVTEKYIEIGLNDEKNTEIISGLSENDTIIVD